MNYPVLILVAALALAVGFSLAWLLSRRLGTKSLAKVEAEAEKIVGEAKKDADLRRKEAALEIREKTLKERAELEREVGERRRELDQAEKEIEEGKGALQKKIDVIDGKERDLGGRLVEVLARAEEQFGQSEREPDLALIALAIVFEKLVALLHVDQRLRLQLDVRALALKVALGLHEEKPRVILFPRALLVREFLQAVDRALGEQPVRHKQ